MKHEAHARFNFGLQNSAKWIAWIKTISFIHDNLKTFLKAKIYERI